MLAIRVAAGFVGLTPGGGSAFSRAAVLAAAAALPFARGAFAGRAVPGGIVARFIPRGFTPFRGLLRFRFISLEHTGKGGLDLAQQAGRFCRSLGRSVGLPRGTVSTIGIRPGRPVALGAGALSPGTAGTITSTLTITAASSVAPVAPAVAITIASGAALRRLVFLGIDTLAPGGVGLF